MKKENLIALLIVLLLGVQTFVAVESRNKPNQTQLPQENQSTLGVVDNRFVQQPTRLSASCGTSSSVIVATSSARSYLVLVNDSANTVYLSLGTPAVGSQGIRLNGSGGSYEMDSEGLYPGAVHCIASSTSVITITEATN